jgi:hypothetical protein
VWWENATNANVPGIGSLRTTKILCPFFYLIDTPQQMAVEGRQGKAPSVMRMKFKPVRKRRRGREGNRDVRG